MRVAKQGKKQGEQPLGLDWKLASRPGSLDLLILTHQLNSGPLTLPKCGKQEAVRRKKLVEQVQKEVIEEVSPVLEAMQSPSGSHLLLERLVEKINAMGFQDEWWVGQSSPHQLSEGEDVIPIDARALKIGARYFLVSRGFNWDLMGKWTYQLVQHMFYRPLIATLETGEFKRLRRCQRRECQRFFVAGDLRLEFCRDQCRITFNNKQRLKEADGGVNYFTKRRHDKRKRDIQKARRLLREGKSLEAVSKIINLSLRVLNRVGLIG